MSTTNKIAVLVIDDHAMTRVGLRNFLSAFDDLELAGEAASGEEGLALYEQLGPDVILIDLKLPGIDGVATIEALRLRHPDLRAIVLTSFPDHELVECALLAGALSYLLKTVSAFELAQAVRAAYAGRSVLAPEASQALVAGMRRTSQQGYQLSSRERDVLGLLVHGRSNAQIAAQLCLAPATVKYHITGILAKFGVASRAEVIARAYEQALVPELQRQAGRTPV